MNKNRGATSVEYAVVCGGIFLVIFLAVNRMGNNVTQSFYTTANVTSNVTNAAIAAGPVNAGNGGAPKP